MNILFIVKVNICIFSLLLIDHVGFPQLRGLFNL